MHVYCVCICVCIDLKPTKSIMRLEEEILRVVTNRMGNGIPIIRKQKGELTGRREEMHGMCSRTVVWKGEN